MVGGGGREHALAWKLRRDDPSLELISAPGNPGLKEMGRTVPVSATDITALTELARRERPALTIVGPEAPLAAGIVDAFRAERLAKVLRRRGNWGWGHVNLIPMNPTPGSVWTASRRSDEDEFVRRLQSRGVPVTVRDTRGREIDGACGQLAAQRL